MPTTPALRAQISDHDYCLDPERPFRPEQSIFLARLAETVLEIPPSIQVYCSSPGGIGVHGLLKSVSRSGIQVLLPVSMPLRGVVHVTIAQCRSVMGQVLYCMKRNSLYQVCIVFSSRYKPDISVGCLAVIKSLDDPLTPARGNVLDVGSTRLSIFCKTMLAPGAWVRVEANGWILFGIVDAVVATSMLASCVDIHLEAAFPAASDSMSQMTEAGNETANSLPPLIFRPSCERDEAGQLESGPTTKDRADCLACC